MLSCSSLKSLIHFLSSKITVHVNIGTFRVIALISCLTAVGNLWLDIKSSNKY